MMAHSMDDRDSPEKGFDSGKYVRYTPEQVEALERVYAECPKPSSLRRQQLIRECPILCNIEPRQIKVWFQNRRVYAECPKPSSLRRQQLIRECPILCNIEPRQIKVWFQNRRCREKQRKESARLQTVNRKLSAMNKLLMEENDRLQKQVSHLVYENGFMKHRINTATGTTTDNGCESVVASGQQRQQQNPTHQHPQRDANNPAGLLSIAEETLAEFLCKATGTAVDWVQMIGMKPGPDSIGIVAVSRNCSGIAARACGLVSLEPMKVAEILKDRPSWFRDCRSVETLSVIPTGNGGTIELINTQIYAPTTLAAARDFWTLRYSTSLEDGSYVVCEKSLTAATGGPNGPLSSSFVRAKMLSSGFLIRPCDGGGSIIHIVDHVDLDVSSVPEVLRPLYESSKILAQKMTVAALRHVRQIAQETSGEVQFSGGRQPAVLRTFSQRLCRIHTGANMFGADTQGCDGDTLLKQLWNHSDAILCCSLKTIASPVFTFANQAGLDMLETTLVALQDIMLDKTLDDSGRKALCSEFAKIMQQGYANLPAGICVSSMGRPVSYEQATVWKVLDDNESNHCLAFILVNWSFV
ncbi:hypothetical protein DY000_02047574 [Brassica cretica]|uniref:Homeobox domain-containing protein n=1 Tax=Brassica cretica TaxID=69181 RepID=A0ABQ7EWF1_BRACR|nr:hypothetical protein DY000_02047574 [Brassica cretica]